MADEQEVAVLKAQLAALQQAGALNTAGKKPRNYVVHAQVMDECYMPTEEPPTPTEPEGSASMHQRLDRIEERLERVIAMLEQRGA
jgi:hypothetical protein